MNRNSFFLLFIGITITEFINFESLLLASDSLYRLAFQLFDRQGQSFITFDDFQYIISATKQFKEFPFNFDSDFVQMHFGVKRQRQITYKEFTQILLGNKSPFII
jgi:solute carrier family 25 aspartate/glutamate transporter 12/13